MNLDDWIALSDEERSVRAKHWRNPPLFQELPTPPAQEWLELTAEAADRFARFYVDLPDLLYVGHNHWFDDENLVGIHARTRLPHGHELAALPREYATFPVTQEAVGDDIRAFKDTWTALLTRLFGFDRVAVVDFVSDQEWVWRDAFFRHDPPREYLPRQALARSAIRSWQRYDEADLCRIGEELVRAIGGRFYPLDQPDFDWNAAQKRIAEVVAAYDRGKSSQQFLS